MFALFIAIVVLATPSIARVFPTRSLVDFNDDITIQDLQKFYADQLNLLGINAEDVLSEGAVSPSNAPEPTPVPEPSHKHGHEEHHHKHEDHHHKHEHQHEDNHHKHEHKDHHHKHNSHAMPPNTPTSAPAQAPKSFTAWFW